MLLERGWLGWLLSGDSCVTEAGGRASFCHSWVAGCCVLVIVPAGMVLCVSGRRDQQGLGGKGWEHVGGRKMDERWMKPLARGIRDHEYLNSEKKGSALCRLMQKISP